VCPQDQVAEARREHQHADVDALVEQDARERNGADRLEVLAGCEAVVDRWPLPTM
jgi:hypothetical protein